MSPLSLGFLASGLALVCVAWAIQSRILMVLRSRHPEVAADLNRGWFSVTGSITARRLLQNKLVTLEEPNLQRLFSIVRVIEVLISTLLLLSAASLFWPQLFARLAA